MTFLWDSGDGDEPALTLDSSDIELLLFLLDNFRSLPPTDMSPWPNADDLSRLGGWLARWKRAQVAWEERDGPEELEDSPF